jgi:hypothetical protein
MRRLLTGRTREFVLAAAVLAAPVLIHFGRVVFLDHVIINPDALALRDPFRAWYAGELKHGRLATWCPTVGLGLPLFAESQMGMLHPLNLAVFSALSARRGDALLTVIECYLAGLFTYACARAMGTGLAGGVLAGLVFMFSGFFLAQEGQVWARSTGMHLPLVMLCAERLTRGRTVAALVCSALVFGVALLAGHFQLTFQAMLAFVLYVLWRGGRTSLRRPRTWLLALTPIVLGLALGAVQVAPTAELRAQSELAAPDRDFLLQNSFPPHHLAAYVLPHMFRAGAEVWERYWGDVLDANFWETFAYVGILPLALAVLSWRRRRAVPAVTPLIALAAVFTLLSFGRWLPGYEYLARLPGFGWFRAPGRYVFVVSFCLAVLSGVGLDEARSTLRERWRRRAWGFVIFALAAAAAGGVLVLLTGSSLAVQRHAYGISLVVLAVSGAAFFGLIRGWRWAAPAALVVAAADLLLLARSIEGFDTRFVRRADFERAGPVVQALAFGPSEGRVGGDRLSWLAAAADQGRPKGAWPWTGSFTPLGFYTSLSPAHAERLNVLTKRPYAEAAPFYRLFSVRYLLSDEPVEDARLTPVFAGIDAQVNLLAGEDAARRVHLYAVDALPRAYLAPAPEVEPADAAGIRFLGECRIVEYAGTWVRLSVHAARPAWVVLNDLDYAGWQARVDGAETEIVRAKGLCRAVAVPAGEHDVVFVFRPRSLSVGGWISLGALAVAGGLAVAAITWRR